MGTSREELGDTSSVETSLSKTKGGTKTSTSSTDDDSIISVVDDRVLGGDWVLRRWEHRQDFLFMRGCGGRPNKEGPRRETGALAREQRFGFEEFIGNDSSSIPKSPWRSKAWRQRPASLGERCARHDSRHAWQLRKQNTAGEFRHLGKKSPFRVAGFTSSEGGFHDVTATYRYGAGRKVNARRLNQERIEGTRGEANWLAYRLPSLVSGTKTTK